ncbi:TPA: N-acetylmuramoyl-L-alanine amidase [Bacillus cereus]|uniref:N-acetylmuramoyl-L-alanine amidase n=1 Tax=Bacillus cereus group TaxID=86661 RepID=UPI0019269B34|nr:N-acetylmuramoyl-L-alanine amidase [Bacillus cereus]MBL3880133.1 N-acetylmuramoyl-L-alanine amidase [Bacillus cereus]HDR7981644.1 N-acetylmuramoyl-L-alanine amidase [Bacillus cereus]HDR8058254.1 N-acetylmuramoyl-L-alanine amidase [Bacillus cereus]HDR8076546.1 N-acetylmuramoyl-L-alanine amidase [Bacillus cereus]HDR8219459.1 N-acetylmuramoyl-L-alanine amidase [Bacillus cereus]
MTRYSNHGGHNEIVQGANYGGRKEHVMDRQVKDAVTAKLRALGHTVYDDTDEVGRTQAQNLNNIVANCNSHDVDLVISYHLNKYDTKANGVEVCYYDQKDLAAKVSAQLSKDIGWRDRGPKQRTDLAVLRGTKAPAILIELGFIDNESDMAKWDVDKIANSIVYALTGQRVGGHSSNTIATSKQNIIQSGAFSPYETPEVMQALTSVKMTAEFILQSDGLTYFVTKPTSDAQLKAMKEYLDRRGWWYEDK